jgi:hypothetical protein
LPLRRRAKRQQGAAWARLRPGEGRGKAPPPRRSRSAAGRFRVPACARNQKQIGI